LARAHPADSFAADALFEAALVSEEHLGDPARAARLYEEVARRYPQSRLARRARTRADFLGASLRTGAQPLAEYQSILSGFSRRPPAESLAKMEALLAAHPDFALADRALYWLGESYAAQHRFAEAFARFETLERRFPSSEWAGRAQKARGDLELELGHPLAARRIYRALAQSPRPLDRAAAAEGLVQVESFIARRIGLALAIAYLLAFLIAHALLVRRLHASLRPPVEVLYYGPVALLFVVAACTENSSIGLATAGIAVGGGLVVWSSSALTTARLRSGAIRLRARLARIAFNFFAVLAAAYIAVQATGLTDLVIETLKSGPDR
jgi:uncharacterized membrane protein YhaH (DUF805 family)